MTITAAIVVFSVVWFLTFYVVLQVRTVTQRDVGEVVPGTPPGAPATETVGRSAKIATVFATLIWAVILGVILSGVITLKDIDIFNRLDFHNRD
jgi:predicted secreted protein